MAKSRWVVAKKRFGYAGRQRDIGEVFELKGLKLDDALWGLDTNGKAIPGRYTEPYNGDPKSAPKCSICGAIFENHGRLECHGDTVHKGEG